MRLKMLQLKREKKKKELVLVRREQTKVLTERMAPAPPNGGIIRAAPRKEDLGERPTAPTLAPFLDIGYLVPLVLAVLLVAVLLKVQVQVLAPLTMTKEVPMLCCNTVMLI
jgi:hypothetical protein